MNDLDNPLFQTMELPTVVVPPAKRQRSRFRGPIILISSGVSTAFVAAILLSLEAAPPTPADPRPPLERIQALPSPDSTSTKGVQVETAGQPLNNSRFSSSDTTEKEEPAVARSVVARPGTVDTETDRVEPAPAVPQDSSPAAPVPDLVVDAPAEEQTEQPEAPAEPDAPAQEEEAPAQEEEPAAEPGQVLETPEATYSFAPPEPDRP